jgi:hypothetical protein
VIGLGLIAAVAGLVLAAAPAGASRGAARPGPAMTTTTPKAGGGSAPAAPSTLVTIFNNFGPGYAYYCCSGWAVSEPGAGGPVNSAMPFPSGAGGYVSQIDVALGHVIGANNATIRLARDNGSGLPGTVLRSWSVAGQPNLGTCCTVATIGVSPLVSLQPGKQYWLIAEAGPNGANDTLDGWNFNSVGDNGGGAQDSGSGYVFFPGNPRGAFDVLGCGKLCKVN